MINQVKCAVAKITVLWMFLMATNAEAQSIASTIEDNPYLRMDADSFSYASYISAGDGQPARNALSSLPEVIIGWPNQNVDFNEGAVYFTVDRMTVRELSWFAAILPGAPWAQITWGASGTLPGTWISHNNLIIVSYEANPIGGKERTATVLLTIPSVSGSPFTLTITQAANPGYSPCAMVYDLSMDLKTTEAKRASVKQGCAEDSVVCYRVPSSQRLKGVLVNCGCTCEALVNAKLYVWDDKTKFMYVKAGTMDWRQLARIGKSNTEVEVAWAFDDLFMCMGFGRFDVNNERITSISGKVVGALPDRSCSENCPQGAAILTYDPCTSEVNEPDATIAYGSWTLRYNRTASKRYAEDNNYLLKIIPVTP